MPFLPRNAVHSADYAVARCPSVRPYVCHTPVFCHQGSVATGRGCARAGGNESQRRLSSAVSPVYSTRTNMHFDTTGTQRSFVHSTTMSPLYRVPAAFAPRDSEPARRGARLPSHVEMSGTKL